MDLVVILKGILVIFLYLGVFVMAGALLPSGYHQNSLVNLCLLGYMVYFSAFQLIALPMKIGCVPLKYLTVVWMLFWVFLFLAGISFRRKTLFLAVRNVFEDREKAVYGALFLAGACVLALVLGMNINHISDFDAGTYIGLPVSSVYSGTIELMDPYSGQMLDAPDHFYIMNTNTIHSAVVFQALNLHPLVEQKFSMTAVLAILFVMLLYKAGQLLFGENRKKALMFTWIAVAALWFSYSIAGTSHYFAYRTYEGKAICAYLYTTAVFVFFLAVFYRKEGNWGWAGLFFAAMSGPAFCNTAIFVIPVMITAFIIPLILVQRRWRDVTSYLIVVFPCILWLGLYMIL